MSLKSSNTIEKNKQELILTIDAAAFEAAIEKVYNKEKSKINIPGFRKGKAKRKVIEAHYGEGVFYEQAINSLIGPEIANAIDETKLEIVDQPSIEVLSIDKENGVELKATCTTKPDITVKEYKGIKAPKVVKTVDEKQINERIDAIRSNNARIVSVDDRAAQMHDEATIDFEGFKDGVAFDGGKGEDYALRLGSGQFIPGFEDQIIGHKVGEEFEINVNFPEDYGMEELAGKPAVFKINLKALSVQELPELDDEFVKDATEFDTVDELKEDTKKKLEETAESSGNSMFENKIFEQLIDNVEDEIPECMFDRRVNMLVADFENSLRQQGMNLELYLQYTGMDEDSFRATFADRAEKEVKLRLVLEKVANMEGLEVTDEEVENGLAEIAANNKMDVDTVKKFIAVPDYKMDLLVNKAAELIKENAVVDNSLAEEENNTEENTEE